MAAAGVKYSLEVVEVVVEVEGEGVPLLLAAGVAEVVVAGLVFEWEEVEGEEER